MNTTVVILAAGLGTRMRSKRAKVLHRAGGLSLIEHVVQAARSVAPPDQIVVVTGHQADAVEELLAPLGVRFARQVEQKGTGHALMCAREELTRKSGLLMVLYGDTPLLSAATLKQLRDEQAASDAAATLITTTLVDPTGYGRVIVDQRGDVRAIVEHSVARPEELAVNLINSGIYCFRSELVWKYLGEIKPSVSGELYLTDMAAILNGHGRRVQQLHVEDFSELLGNQYAGRVGRRRSYSPRTQNA